VAGLGGVDGPAVLAAVAWEIGTEAIGTYTGAGGQCRDAIETGFRADGPARILHTGTRSRGLGQGKSGTGRCLRNARLGGQNG